MFSALVVIRLLAIVNVECWPVPARGGVIFCLIKSFLKNLALAICLLLLYAIPCLAEIQLLEDKPSYALSVYGGRMVDNDIDEFVDNVQGIEFEDSYLLALALARRIATHGELASFEVEGQIVKHFDQQDHWEFTALLTSRWEDFFWDKYLDTSFAVGVGPSYATKVPEIEVQRFGESERLQAYMMVELEFVLPSQPNIAVIARIHHRSGAFGAVADDGASNALAFGFRFRI